MLPNLSAIFFYPFRSLANISSRYTIYILLTIQDGRFYPVEVTAVGDSTAVVLFTEYGNHEEVVWDDIRPISTNYNQGGAFNRGHPPPSHYRR